MRPGRLITGSIKNIDNYRWYILAIDSIDIVAIVNIDIIAKFFSWVMETILWL